MYVLVSPCLFIQHSYCSRFFQPLLASVLRRVSIINSKDFLGTIDDEFLSQSWSEVVEKDPISVTIRERRGGGGGGGDYKRYKCYRNVSEMRLSDRIRPLYIATEVLGFPSSVSCPDGFINLNTDPIM